MATELPAPPVPPTIDLRGLPYMPLDVVRLRDSELSVITKGDEFRCAVLLWCAAWHQVPAASLPDDDALLAQLAGFGRVVKEWKRVRTGALRGFVKCSDGRLYHEVVAEKALDAWRGRLEQRWRTECARLKKQGQRTHEQVELPEFDLWISRECPESIQYLSPSSTANVPRDATGKDAGQSQSVPRETASKRSEVKGSSSNNHRGNGDSIADPATAAGCGDQDRKPGVLARILAECTRAKLEQGEAALKVIEAWATEGATPSQVATALAEARRSMPEPKTLTAGYVTPILMRNLQADRDARRAVDTRLASTQATIAEGKAALLTRADPPPGFMAANVKHT